MTLRLRNTLTRRVEPVEPLEPGRVRMYTCGPTVYRYAHIGNLRSYLLADFIRRALLHHGLDVLHVKNITDVGHLRDERLDRGEDRMLVAAGLEGRSPGEIAAAYEAAFHADEAAVGVLPAHVFPRATEHIPDMLALAERLVDRGAAYVTGEGVVYFDVGRSPDYGRLSGNSLEALRAGHRVAVEPDKRDPADFVLWRHAEAGRILRWPSRRWGEGFPGWHIECSAMALRYLGQQFDLHTGGIDNVFPHHEDEIAQTAALTGTPPARHWVHGEHLLMRGHKMAKSAGNFLRITELAEEGVDPLAFRYLALTVHYARKLNLSPDSLRAADAALRSLRSRLRALGPAPADGPWAAPVPLVAGQAGERPSGVAAGVAGHQASAAGRPYEVTDRAHGPAAPLSRAGRALHDRFVAALDDDLDLPVALAVVRETLRTPLPPDERRWLVLDADAVVGLDLHRVWEPHGAAGGARKPGEPTDRPPADGTDDAAGPDALPPDVARLVEERARARAERDWPRADELRREVAALGWELVDGPSGTTARRPVRS